GPWSRRVGTRGPPGTGRTGRRWAQRRRRGPATSRRCGMRVLVLEDVLGAGDGVADRLEASGSRVVRCHEPGAPAGVCVGMPGGTGCPLETGAVDVALSVRAATGPVTVVEDGVRCALRNHVPLVTLGAPEDSPWVAMATATVTDPDTVAEVVRDAADAPLRHHGAIAAGELRAVLDRHELPS